MPLLTEMLYYAINIKPFDSAVAVLMQVHQADLISCGMQRVKSPHFSDYNLT